MVSVLITSLNGGSKLERLLESLKRQTQALDEIILIDDGSDPKLVNYSPEVKLKRNENSRGVIACRNELASLAKGEYMVFLDDDVILDDPNLLCNALNLMRGDPYAAVLGFMQRGLNGDLLDLQPCTGEHFGQVKVYFGWAHIILKSVWLKVGCFVEEFHYGWEETEFSLRLLDAGYKVICDPSLSVTHDVVSKSKNMNKRNFLNERNNIITILLHYPLSLLPSWIKGAFQGTRPHHSSKELLYIYRLKIAFSIIRMTQFLVLKRSPVSKITIKKFHELP